MAKAKPAGAERLGRTMYLFRSSTNSKDCMISAHGGYIFENRTFKVPANTTINFYSDHGAVLNDPGIGTFAKDASKAKPRESITAGKNCRNYLLSKYQGAHAGADGKSVRETYQQVAQAVSNRDLIRTKKFERLMASDSKTQIARLNDLMSDWGGSILTIRNRWNILTGVPLRDAVRAAQKADPAIRVFHCVFCRSNMLAAESPDQDVQFEY
ncbi:MAG: hypothetical protein HKN70_10880 [Gammaproteobacteria bacterium]|nr:hypothetical protein [Gammaproteobacteria bacterium]